MNAAKKENESESAIRNQTQKNISQQLWIKEELEAHPNLYVFSDILVSALPSLLILIFQASREVQRLPQQFRK